MVHIFKTVMYVEDAVIERTKHAIFGYTETGADIHNDAYFNAVAGWMKRHHDWDVDPRWLVKTPGVVFALAMAVKAFNLIVNSLCLFHMIDTEMNCLPEPLNHLRPTLWLAQGYLDDGRKNFCFR